MERTRSDDITRPEKVTSQPGARLQTSARVAVCVFTAIIHHRNAYFRVWSEARPMRAWGYRARSSLRLTALRRGNFVTIIAARRHAERMFISFAEELVELERTRVWNIVFAGGCPRVPSRDTFQGKLFLRLANCFYAPWEIFSEKSKLNFAW